MSTTPPTFTTADRQFKLYCTGQTISTIGSFMQGMALAWLTFRITSSASLFGLALFVRQLPILLLAPFGGWLLDRMDRRQLMIFSQVLGAIPAFLAAYISHIGGDSFVSLFLLAITMGIVNGLETPARSTFVSDLVDKSDLPKAVKINSLIVNIGRLVGPALAGVLAYYIGEWICFAVNGVSNIFFVVLLLFIQPRPREPQSSQEHKGFWAGMRYAYAHKSVRRLLLLMTSLSLVAVPFISLLPLFSVQMLHGDAKITGWLMAAAACGGMVGGLGLVLKKARTKQVPIIGAAVVMAGLSLIVFSGIGNLVAAALLVFLIGLSLVVAGTSINVAVQVKVPNEVRGRVTALFSMAYLGITPFGSLAIGAMSTGIGPSRAIMVMGAICLTLPILFFPIFFGGVAAPVADRAR